ncbi:isoprenyl transferase [Paenibacillus sp. GCM10028914]|uniref:isoprenyl transferase n=1 Tax=Paenibacillus sp. GCM10028914 TaxID=3273416 RepID=UPI003617D3CD
MLFKKSNHTIPEEVLMETIPEHIAIMMDGNGRWAKKRGLPRTSGHYAGMNTMREIIRNCHELKVKYLTLYAFSTENWTRPEEEVNYLIHLPKLFFQKETIDEIKRGNMQIRYIGDTTKFPKAIQDIMQESVEMTQMNTGMIINFAMNYGGKADIIQAIQHCLQDNIDLSEMTEEIFESYLYTKGCPAPDLIIRTSGEKRLSNFLLWQSAQAELWFTETLWPDFNRDLLVSAIAEYKERKNR